MENKVFWNALSRSFFVHFLLFRLEQSEIQLDDTIFVLQMYLEYNKMKTWSH